MDFITKYRPLLQQGLDDFITSKYKPAGKDINWLNDLLDRLKLFVSSGKLLRGCLVCYSYEICSGKPADEKVINAAMAIELMHSGLIIQDDIMDQDEYRRTMPALHYQYIKRGEEQNLSDPYSFGVNMAICGSDIAIFYGHQLLTQSILKPKINNELQRVFSDTLAEVCNGQMQDIYLEESTDKLSKETIFNLMEAKTASYSVALPLTTGAILAGSPSTLKETLHRIGIDAGIIFQIRDDELGAFGDSKKLGKPVGSDIIKCKKTLLYHYLLENCTAEERKKFGLIFGNEAAEPSDIKYVQKIMKQHRVPELLSRDVAELRKSAINSIETLDMEDKTKDQLKNLVEFCATRQA